MITKYGKRMVYGFVDNSPAGEPGGLAVDNEQVVTHHVTF